MKSASGSVVRLIEPAEVEVHVLKEGFFEDLQTNEDSTISAFYQAIADVHIEEK